MFTSKWRWSSSTWRSLTMFVWGSSVECRTACPIYVGGLLRKPIFSYRIRAVGDLLETRQEGVCTFEDQPSPTSCKWRCGVGGLGEKERPGLCLCDMSSLSDSSWQSDCQTFWCLSLTAGWVAQPDMTCTLEQQSVDAKLEKLAAGELPQGVPNGIQGGNVGAFRRQAASQLSTCLQTEFYHVDLGHWKNLFRGLRTSSHRKIKELLNGRPVYYSAPEDNVARKPLYFVSWRNVCVFSQNPLLATFHPASLQR